MEYSSLYNGKQNSGLGHVAVYPQPDMVVEMHFKQKY
jgi:hypothetical protein